MKKFNILLLILSISFIGAICENTPNSNSIEINIQENVWIHSHNDYQTREPLYEALRKGCQIIEADIIIDHKGDLVLAHDTNWYNEYGWNYGLLKDVYLQPMRDICKIRNVDLWLFIELKDDSFEIKDKLYNLLKKYETEKLHYLIGAWDFDGEFSNRITLLNNFMNDYSEYLDIELVDIFFTTHNITTIDL